MLPFTYVALGDSTAVGYGARDKRGYVHRLYEKISQRKHRVRLENLGENGARLRKIADDQVVEAIRLSPGVVTFFAGANDVIAGRRLEDIASDLDLAALRLRYLSCPVVVATLPDLMASPLAPYYGSLPGMSLASLGQRFDAVNSCVRSMARRFGYVLSEVHEPSRVMLRQHPDFFCPDGLHPSSAGYQAIADAMWPAIARAIGEAEK